MKANLKEGGINIDLEMGELQALRSYQVKENKDDIKSLSKRIRFLEFAVLIIGLIVGREIYLFLK